MIEHRIEHRNYCWGHWNDYHCITCDEKISLCSTPTQLEFKNKQEFLLEHSPNINPETHYVQPLESIEFEHIFNSEKTQFGSTLQADYESKIMKKDEDILKFFIEPLKLKIHFLSVDKCEINTRKHGWETINFLVGGNVISFWEWSMWTKDLEFDNGILKNPEILSIKRRKLLNKDGSIKQVGYKVINKRSSRKYLDFRNSEFQYLQSR
jgi:hypothetical protein